jgi:hypothetical protein
MDDPHLSNITKLKKTKKKLPKTEQKIVVNSSAAPQPKLLWSVNTHH